MDGSYYWILTEMKRQRGVFRLCFCIGIESIIKRVMFPHVPKQQANENISTEIKSFWEQVQTFSFSCDNWRSEAFITTLASKWKTFQQNIKSRNEVSLELNLNIWANCTKNANL